MKQKLRTCMKKEGKNEIIDLDKFYYIDIDKINRNPDKRCPL